MRTAVVRVASQYPTRLCHHDVVVSALSKPKRVTNEPFQLRLINQRDFAQHQQVMDVIRGSFYPPESARKVRGLSQAALATVLDTRAPDILKQGLSIALVDIPGRIAGVAVNNKVSRTEEMFDFYQQSTAQPSVKAVLSCLLQLQRDFSESENFSDLGESEGMNIFYLAVKDRFCGHGLGRRLTRQSIDLARERRLGFVQTFTMGTDEASSRLFDELKFVTVGTLQLAGYQMDGAVVFPHAGPDDLLRMVVKVL